MIHRLFISKTFCESSSLQQVASSKHHATIWKKTAHRNLGLFGSVRGVQNPSNVLFFCSFRKRKIGGFDFRMTCLLHFFFEWEVTLGMILFVSFFAFCWMVSDWPAICDVHREILLVNFFNRDRDGKSLWLLQIGFSLCFLQDSAPCCTLRIRGSNGRFFFTIAGVLWGGPQTSHFWKGLDSEGISKWTYTPCKDVFYSIVVECRFWTLPTSPRKSWSDLLPRPKLYLLWINLNFILGCLGSEHFLCRFFSQGVGWRIHAKLWGFCTKRTAVIDTYFLK